MDRRDYMKSAGLAMSGVDIEAVGDWLYDVVIAPEDDANSVVEDFGSGTRILLKPGIHDVNPIELYDSQTIEGAGMGATTVKLKSGDDQGRVFHAVGVSDIAIRDLTIDVNGANQYNEPGEGTRGIEHLGNGRRSVIERVEVKNATGHGIKWFDWIDGKAIGCWCHSGVGEDSGRGAIEAGATDTVTKRIGVFNCLVDTGGQTGIGTRYSNTEHIIIANNWAIQGAPGAAPIRVDGSANASVVGNWVDANGQRRSIRVFDSTHVTVASNVLVDTASESSVTEGLRVARDSRHVTVSHNIVRDHRTADAFQADGISDAVFIGNVAENCKTGFKTRNGTSNIQLWGNQARQNVTPYDVEDNTIINGETVAAAAAEKPHGSYPPGTLIRFTDTGDGSGTGTYLCTRDGGFVRLV